jgi:hypothetical protein
MEIYVLNCFMIFDNNRKEFKGSNNIVSSFNNWYNRQKVFSVY